LDLVDLVDLVSVIILATVAFTIPTQPLGTGLIASTILIISTVLVEDFTIPIIHPMLVFMGATDLFTTIPFMADMVLSIVIHTTG